MALALDEVAPYLLERGLLSPKAVVEGDIQVHDVSRHNCVFLVRAPQPYVLKVGDRVAREAACLERIRNAAPALSAQLPAPVALDRERNVLILQAGEDASDFTRCQDPGQYSRLLARQMGKVLGTLHALPAEQLREFGAGWDLGAVFRVHDVAWPDLQRMAGAAVHVIRAAQHIDGLGWELEALVADSEAAEPVPIHGDVRWENCLGLAVRSGGRRSRVQLIDWEYAACGDPAIDVGSYFGEHLRAWTLRHPTLVGPLADAELLRVQSGVGAFWAAYAKARPLGVLDAGRLLRRAVRHAGARLVVAATEEARGYGQPVPWLETYLHAGASVLRRPDSAAVKVLGLRPAWAS